MIAWCETQEKTIQSPELNQKIEQLYELFHTNNLESASTLMGEIEEEQLPFI